MNGGGGSAPCGRVARPVLLFKLEIWGGGPQWTSLKQNLKVRGRVPDFQNKHFCLRLVPES